MSGTLARTVEWIASPKQARTIGLVTILGSSLLLAVNLAIYIWNPAAWFPNYLWSLAFLLIPGFATLFQIPTRVGVDGPTLRVRFPMRERRIALADIVATDLAPGRGSGYSVLHIASRRADTIALNLEKAAADAVASQLERQGLFVNRTPPPVLHLPNSVRAMRRKGF